MTFSRGGATVLVAEDDPIYGESLADLLRREGHAVHHVFDGDAAIECIREMSERLDLLLCDLLLPKRTGFEVVKEINELELSLPVLAMTGVYEHGREVDALRGLGVKGYLHKSTPFEQVLFRVNNVLFPSTDNQRGNYRVAVSMPVQFVRGGRASYGTSYNLSVTGVYVRTHEPMLAGSTVDLSLALPTAREMIPVKAEIVHSATAAEVRGTAYPAGFGARFIDVTPLGLAAIKRFVGIVHREETTGESLGAPRFDIVEEPVEV